MAILSDRVWQRHANPASGWSRLLTYPLVYAPLWNRSWTQGAAVATWFTVNPVLFDKPEDDSAWMTRAVYGEELWSEHTAEQLQAGEWSDLLSDPNTQINAASAVAFAGAARSAWEGKLLPTILCASATFGLKLLFVSRMVKLYDESKSETS